MARFVVNCQRTFSECTRLALSDNVETDSGPIITRMETMQRSISWARGRLIEPDLADEMQDIISEFLQELRTLTQQQVGQGYRARQVVGRTTIG
ncbi:hypothetical protein COCON_G00133200 [Conger conger]|uniref:Uncharacterized protein n=1 Tax=Conger conger TaxID=82655 RepID=A0A9Q1HVP4_CONCO|nr:hypothetical protein COCON_G00133200 [Conger conger]